MSVRACEREKLFLRQSMHEGSRKGNLSGYDFEFWTRDSDPEVIHYKRIHGVSQKKPSVSAKQKTINTLDQLKGKVGLNGENNILLCIASKFSCQNEKFVYEYNEV